MSQRAKLRNFKDFDGFNKLKLIQVLDQFRRDLNSADEDAFVNRSKPESKQYASEPVSFAAVTFRDIE